MTDPTELVPLALLAGEVGDTADRLANALAPDLVRDDIGLRCVPADIARHVIDAHLANLEENRRREERNRQVVRDAAAKARPVPAGVPALEGLTPAESMRAVTGYATVNDDYGRPKPNFLEDELAKGQRRLNESQRT